MRCEQGSRPIHQINEMADIKVGCKMDIFRPAKLKLRYALVSAITTEKYIWFDVIQINYDPQALLLAILKASGQDDENLIPLSVFRFLQWLGYINSFLNPLIYAKFNREFRLPFRLILLCQCRDMNARLRSAAFSAQYGLPTGGSRRMSSTNRSASNRVNRRSLLERTSIQRPQPSATQARL
ncbi:uncharacterized protein DEA37_0005248 [Paragonimus westermani]|uniref:G-protein coupled receptors family 1 profile domain-containing protein n=1 Tax=Paragonimus westermani TaxID=34504 RepID=A0A5J4NYN2_9TREM|nr:uncharacterized protein DEA37_0005248 [Paragonimus westermani]